MSSGALLILTGPSHAGKTTAARSAMRSLGVPSAHVAIDEIIAWLDLAADELWEHGLPAAYDVAAEATDALLRRDFVVLLESTFTFIPDDDRPAQFHDDQLARFVRIGRDREAPVTVVRFGADLDELLRRQAGTGRLHRGVVEGTWGQHSASIELDVPIVDVATAGLAPEEMAARVRAALAGPPR